MKKKVILIVMSLCLLAFMGGCKKQSLTDQLGAGNTPTSGASTDGTTPTGAPVKEAYTASDYVTLGQYKGVEVTVQKLEVTDTDLQSAIDSDLQANATTQPVTDRPVQSGDTVNIDFEGVMDGKPFDGGTATGYDLEIGSGSFIPGFEDGIIGAKTGDKLAIDLTFPQDYKEDLAGKAVTFNVTVNSISEKIIPELTEDYVKNNTDYDSIDAYKEAKRQELEATNSDTMQQEKSNNVLKAIIDGSTFSSVPQNLIDYYAYSYKSYNEQMLYYFYGITLDDYLTQTNTSQEDFDKQVQTVAENYAKAEMVKKAVAETEGMQISDADYQELLPQYLTDNGVDTEESLLQYETKDQTKENMLMQKAMDFIVDQAVVTETTATPTPEPTVAP